MRAAIRPIGPAPVTSTSSPTSGKVSAVCTALPSGSKIAARSGSIPAGCTQRLPAGTATNSAKAPSRSTPMLEVRMHMCRRPARQLRQMPHTTWPSALTRSPILTDSTPAPSSTTTPENSCPGISGGRIAPAAQ